MKPRSKPAIAIASEPDRRVADRYSLSLPVEVMTLDDVPIASYLTNLSYTGFRVETSVIVAVGTKLRIRLPGTGKRRVIVAWQRGPTLGCRFLRPIETDLLADLLSQGRSARA